MEIKPFMLPLFYMFAYMLTAGCGCSRGCTCGCTCAYVRTGVLCVRRPLEHQFSVSQCGCKWPMCQTCRPTSRGVKRTFNIHLMAAPLLQCVLIVSLIYILWVTFCRFKFKAYPTFWVSWNWLENILVSINQPWSTVGFPLLITREA